MFNQTHQFWDERLGNAEGVRSWFTYSFEYLDDLSFMPEASEVLGSWPEGEQLILNIQDKLKNLGWAGDGVLQIMWLPSFTGAGPNNNFGCYVIHVKQESDGISWLASPFALPFHRLFESEGAQYFPAGKAF